MADPKKTKKPETVDPVPPAVVEQPTVSVSSTASATLTDSPPSSDVAPTADPEPPAVVEQPTVSVSSTAPATLTDSPPSSDAAHQADPELPAGPEASTGTTVPTEGHQVSEQPKGKNGLTIVQFLGPHRSYSRGDQAGFGADYAQDLVDRNIACWPKDFASKVKKNADDYPYAY